MTRESAEKIAREPARNDDSSTHRSIAGDVESSARSASAGNSTAKISSFIGTSAVWLASIFDVGVLIALVPLIVLIGPDNSEMLSRTFPCLLPFFAVALLRLHSSNSVYSWYPTLSLLGRLVIVSYLATSLGRTTVAPESLMLSGAGIWALQLLFVSGHHALVDGHGSMFDKLIALIAIPLSICMWLLLMHLSVTPPSAAEILQACASGYVFVLIVRAIADLGGWRSKPIASFSGKFPKLSDCTKPGRSESPTYGSILKILCLVAVTTPMLLFIADAPDLAYTPYKEIGLLLSGWLIGSTVTVVAGWNLEDRSLEHLSRIAHLGLIIVSLALVFTPSSIGVVFISLSGAISAAAYHLATSRWNSNRDKPYSNFLSWILATLAVYGTTISLSLQSSVTRYSYPYSKLAVAEFLLLSALFLIDRSCRRLALQVVAFPWEPKLSTSLPIAPETDGETSVYFASSLTLNKTLRLALKVDLPLVVVTDDALLRSEAARAALALFDIFILPFGPSSIASSNANRRLEETIKHFTIDSGRYASTPLLMWVKEDAPDERMIEGLQDVRFYEIKQAIENKEGVLQAIPIAPHIESKVLAVLERDP